MAEYQSLEHSIERHQKYPDLRQDLLDHEFQRRRVMSSVKFIKAGDIVLDVGCNTGYFAGYAKHARQVHGVDVNIAHVEEARKVMTSVEVAPAEALPFDAKTFDVVNVSGLLEQAFDPIAVIREAARVSRRSVVGNTVHESGCWGKSRTERHQWQARSWSEAEIRTLLEPFGRLDVLDTININTPPEPQCWYWHLVVHE